MPKLRILSCQIISYTLVYHKSIVSQKQNTPKYGLIQKAILMKCLGQFRANKKFLILTFYCGCKEKGIELFSIRLY